MTLREDWEELIEGQKAICIFGASSVAKRLLFLLKEYGKDVLVKEFIVSSMNDNPTEIEGIAVKEIASCVKNDACVLVSVSKIYHPEVFELLSRWGYSNIVEAHRFYNLELKENSFAYDIDENCFIDYSNESELTSNELEARNTIVQLFKKSSQAFGEKIFYQSFEKIGIKGLRPTNYRIKKYGIKDLVNSETEVLDIGCNYGFLDLTLSNLVSSITGVEYNEKLVEIATMAASLLDIHNVIFECNDFKKWREKNKKKYDIIFSFAVHIWLNVSPEEYAIQLYEMLKKGGRLIFESQDMLHDKKFDEFCKCFLEIGFLLEREDIMKDDGKINRKFVVYKKE